jgi:hypothetical protein
MSIAGLLAGIIMPHVGPGRNRTRAVQARNPQAETV